MENKNSVKFYQRNWFIILTLIVFFPLGIFLMWKNKKWTKNVRIILSVVSVLFFFIVIGSGEDSAPKIDDQVDAQSASANNNNELEDKKKEELKKEQERKEQEEKEAEERKKKEEERKKKEEEEEQKKQKEERKKQEQEKKSQSAIGNLHAHFIDVGQADATLFQFEGESGSYNILFDTGDWRRKDAVNYLNSQGINKLDLVIISHPHADHIGQLEHVMNGFDVKEVWMSPNTANSNVYQNALTAVLNSDAEYHEPKAGEVFDVGPLKLEVIHPSTLTGDLNADSISVRLTFGSVAFILTGDAYVSSERQMVNRGNIKAQILSLGHHGSNTSTDQSFLNAVNPDIAIYSAAANSQYGHPHPDVVSRIKNSNIKLYGTDVHGNIVVKTDGKKFNVSTGKEGNVVAKQDSSNKQQGSTEKGSNSSQKGNTQSQKSEKDKKEEKPKQETTPATGNCININSASFEELQNIKHIGDDRANQILELRPFKSVDDMSRIKGIGPARLKDIKAEGIACVK